MNFEEYLKEFEPRLKRLVRRYHIEFLENCDIEQELRIHLFNKFNKFDGTNFKSWAYKVCKRKLIDLIKKYKRNNRSGYESLDKYLDNGWDVREDKKIVKRGLYLKNRTENE